MQRTLTHLVGHCVFSRYFTTDQASSVELLHSPVDFHGMNLVVVVMIIYVWS